MIAAHLPALQVVVPLMAKMKKMVIMAPETVAPTPNSIREMPRCWPITGLSASTE